MTLEVGGTQYQREGPHSDWTRMSQDGSLLAYVKGREAKLLNQIVKMGTALQWIIEDDETTARVQNVCYKAMEPVI